MCAYLVGGWVIDCAVGCFGKWLDDTCFLGVHYVAQLIVQAHDLFPLADVIPRSVATYLPHGDLYHWSLSGSLLEVSFEGWA